jgi:serine/threonine protein kinase/tetratricopeptide (TPR) repeat protein
VTPLDWSRVADIYSDALELPADRRAAFVDAECAGQPEMLAAVQRLLIAGNEADPSFLTSIDRDLLGAVVDDAATSLDRIGPWRVVREIGRGGMGQVLLAERADGQYDQQVAIKLLKRGMDSDAILTRFLRERRILAALDHPNIARLIDGGIAEDGRPYFVMEHVDGESITAFADARRLTVDARLTLFRSVCLAVEYAHRNLVVHRDLKPSNILVTADGRPKLLDFGIAKLLSAPNDHVDTSTLTAVGGRLLTPDYAAPEQFHGGAITTATDVYGLGAVLFELLVGQPPFGGDDSTFPRRARASDQEPAAMSVTVSSLGRNRESAAALALTRGTEPGRLSRQLAGDLDTIVATALRAAPDRRYPAVSALDDDVLRHQERLPVRARPDTLGYRASRFVRRHRLAVVASGVIAILLVAFGVSTTLQARALAVERDRARLEATAAREVSEFLVGVFQVADPMSPVTPGQTREVRASDLLDRGAMRIESDLTAQPAVQARLLGVIGQAYDNLQRGDRAEPVLARAVELQRKTGGPENPALVTALQQLGRARARRADFDGAKLAFREATDVQRRIAPVTAAMWGLLVERAYVHDAGGDHETGRALRKEAMELFNQLGPEDFGDSRAELQRMADLMSKVPPPVSNDADSVFARLVQVERAASGDSGAPVASALTAWASSKTRRRQLATADSMLASATAIHAAAAPASIAVANTLNMRSMVVMQIGDLARAESLAREAVRVLVARLGEDHREVALMRMSLGFILQRLGRIDEAIAMSRLTNVTLARDTNDAVALLPQNQWDVGLLLYRSGRVDESLGEFAAALRTFETRFPPEYLVTAAVRRDYGAALVDAGRPAEAERVLRPSIDVLAKRYGADNVRVDAVRISLARALAAQGRREDARRLLVDVVSRLSSTRGAADSLTRRARGVLDGLERPRAGVR